MKKIRILFNTEAHYLASGYGVYTKELLSRLYSTGKYEIAELASFAERNDPRNQQVPWKFYPVKPDPNNKADVAAFEASPYNAFGQWLFESVLLDFKPDVVCSWRDPWMSRFEITSVFRKYYKHLIMPTVDASPLMDNWLDMYSQADGVFTYSDWGQDLLKQSAPNVKLLGSAPPAAEYDLFQMPFSKKEQKQKMGVSPDIIIIGTTMRNQKRKRYPELIAAFAKFLKVAPKDLAQKTYLYLHTAWPDWMAWDIPLLVKEYELADKVILTYHCLSCGLVFPSQFHYAITTCPRCNSNSARMPSVSTGISRAALANIMQMFDVYVQYASFEGFGMPMVEAAACGIPVFAVDYSAMTDVVRKIDGIPIKIKHLDREVETNRFIAIPDNDDFIEKLIKYLKQPTDIKNKHSFNIATECRKYYNWDVTAKKWADAIDNLEYPEHRETWLSPPKTYQMATAIPTQLPNSDFVKWCLEHIAHRPELVGSYTEASILRNLTWGITLPSIRGPEFSELSVLDSNTKNTAFSRENVIAMCREMCEANNIWEQRRWNLVQNL